MTSSTRRTFYFDQAKRSVASSWTEDQKLIGPLIVIPYVLKHQIKTVDQSGNENIKYKNKQKYRFLLPDDISINSRLIVDKRSKGIHEIPVYTSRLKINAAISSQKWIQAIQKIESSSAFSVSVKKPYLSVNITDPRGINSISKLRWLNKEIDFKPGSRFTDHRNGVHAMISTEELTSGKEVNFGFDMELRGMETISFIPTALEAFVSIDSEWPHPQFVGRFLPSKRTVSDQGYQASWKVSSFASNIEDKVEKCESGNCAELQSSDFGVKHIEAVDVYLLSDRSIKYSLLFIALSFLSFYLFEIMKKLPIHGVQYTLVGAAIALFYLLLLSLSEHLSFSIAFLIASISCIALIFFYLGYVLKGFKNAFFFAVLLSSLYTVLYVIINAEDVALLMGSILCFVSLASVMVITRKIDWYRESEKLGNAIPTASTKK